MKYEGASRRRRERQELQLPVQVDCRESTDDEWTATAQLLDVTPFGARILLARPTEPGRLLHLAMPLPSQLRCYDYEHEKYIIWGLVRHIKVLDAKEDRAPEFEIGVAFVGKEPPQSFVMDPARRYRLNPASIEDALWSVNELSEPDAEEKSERRAEARRKIEDDVTIEVYDADGRVYRREITKTRNISRRGMCVRSTLNVLRGRYVRVRSVHYKIAVIAAVRRLRRDTDGLKYLHLEFVDQQWPPLTDD